MKRLNNTHFFICYLIVFIAVAGSGCKRTSDTKTTEFGYNSIPKETMKDSVINGDTVKNGNLNDTGNNGVANLSKDNDHNKVSETTKPTPSGFEPHIGFVLVRDYVPDVIEDIRYFTTNNFMGEKANGYEANAAIISKPAAKRLKEAADELRSMGYVIKIYDAYRPQQAVNHFVNWAQGPDQKNKKDYYPSIEKRNLFPRYIARKSGHSKGSTVDLTICYQDTKEEVDMGSHFDYFGPPSHTTFMGAYPGGNINKTHNKNRMILKHVMEKHGFTNYSNEWWHYTLNNQPFPNSYFNFPVRDKK